MTFTRRSILGAAAAAPLTLAAGASAVAADGHAAVPGAALYDAPLGNYRITALLDGIAPLGRGFFFGPDAAAIDAAIAEVGIGPDTLPAPVTAFLLRSEDRTILIDAGMGAVDILGPGFGRLSAGLAAAGVASGDVDTILITHLHPDHIGGLLGANGPAFPNAEVIVAEAEAGFWLDAAMAAAAPAEAQGLFQLAGAAIGAYGDAVTQVADGAEVAPGVTLNVSPGHTPGHSILRIDGGDRQLLMVADSMHSADLHLALPETGFGFDTDPGLAAQSRGRILDTAATDKMLIAGSHIHFPGFGRVLRNGDAFRYAPATWM